MDGLNEHAQKAIFTFFFYQFTHLLFVSNLNQKIFYTQKFSTKM